MASQADIAAVQQFYDEVARGNFWVGKEIFDPAIEWEWGSSLSGITGNKTYHGFSEASWDSWDLPVDAPAQDAPGQSWAFSSWSDAGAATHSIHTPSSPA